LEDAVSLGKLTVALDVDREVALSLAEQISGVVPGVKVGMTLFTQAGPSLVKKLVEMDFEVFLDLKYHDIPHQVEGAVKKACDLGVSLLTVHTSGGRAMMEAAARGVEGYQTQVVGVSVLTSMTSDDLSEVCVRGPLEGIVDIRAQLAQESGLDGVVASPNELRLLRDSYPSPFLIVTPGVRPKGSDLGDQRRVATPEEALLRGSDLLVMGRPITGASSPRSAAVEIMTSIAGRG